MSHTRRFYTRPSDDRFQRIVDAGNDAVGCGQLVYVLEVGSDDDPDRGDVVKLIADTEEELERLYFQERDEYDWCEVHVSPAR